MCGKDFDPDAPHRFSLRAQEREQEWLAAHPQSVAIAETAEEPTTKVCPECAEEVKAAAAVCRFCSHRFSETASSATTSPATTSPASASAVAAAEDPRAARLHPVSVALILAGVLALVIGLLLPYAETPPAFSHIVDNTVLQHGEWQYPIGGAVALGLLYWAWRTGSRSWRIAWAGIVMLGWSVYDLANAASRTYGYVDLSGRTLPSTANVVASPGTGLYLVTLGSILVLAGGLLHRYPRLIPSA